MESNRRHFVQASAAAPTLLARLSVQTQRAVVWDEKNLAARFAS
jgi:hypothetical protein